MRLNLPLLACAMGLTLAVAGCARKTETTATTTAAVTRPTAPPPVTTVAAAAPAPLPFANSEGLVDDTHQRAALSPPSKRQRDPASGPRRGAPAAWALPTPR